MSYLLAIDQGTSSTRAALYTIKGQLLHLSQRPLKQSYPKSGWVEHDPHQLWATTKATMQEVLLNIDRKDVLACGVTNQRETTLLWNRQTGECLYPAIVWQDRRTHAFCQTLQAHHDVIQSKTGLIPDAYFSASKLRWLLDNIPHARQLASCGELAFGTVDSYLIWQLTGGKTHATDVTNASRTLLFNIIEQRWDDELLQLFDVPVTVLPQVKASDAHFGVIDTHLPAAGVPITGVAGDQQASMIGQGCLDEGMIKATFGTGGFLLLNTGERPIFSKHRLLTTISYQMENTTIYGLEGSLYQAGTTVKWLRDEMKLIKNACDTESLANRLTSNEGVYMIPSFTGLGAPHWLMTTGAMIVGLSRTSTVAHFARAALESVCYQTRDVLECMREDTGLLCSTLRVDGGMSVNQWFLQFLASQCRLQVQRAKECETTVLGAAMLAAIGRGIMDRMTLRTCWNSINTYVPGENEKDIERDYQGWLHAINALKVMKNGREGDIS